MLQAQSCVDFGDISMHHSMRFIVTFPIVRVTSRYRKEQGRTIPLESSDTICILSTYEKG